MGRRGRGSEVGLKWTIEGLKKIFRRNEMRGIDTETLWEAFLLHVVQCHRFAR